MNTQGPVSIPLIQGIILTQGAGQVVHRCVGLNPFNSGHNSNAPLLVGWLVYSCLNPFNSGHNSNISPIPRMRRSLRVSIPLIQGIILTGIGWVDAEGNK